MYKDLNPLLHSQLRLTIISFLIKKGESDFAELKDITNSTSGNLSVQLSKLQKAEYIIMEKGFKNNYQHTSVKIEEKGINAFEEYVKAIQGYLKE